MKKVLVALISCLALAAAPLTGCGDSDDPSANNDAVENNSNGTNNNEDNNNEDNNNEDNNDEDNNDDNNDEDLDPSDCEVNEDFTGQAFEDTEGGVVTYEEAEELDDANLQAVYDAVPGEEGSEELAEPISVSGALVVATAYEGNVLWLVDQNAAIVAWYPFGDSEPTEDVQVGDMVSFEVTEVENFGGDPQIGELTDFVVDSSDNPVPFHEMTGEEPSMDQWGQLVRIGGMITEDEGECGGGNLCYELTHGEDELTITYRSDADWNEVGVCVTFFGPLGSFPGPLADDGEPQLDEVTWDWSRDE